MILLDYVIIISHMESITITRRIILLMNKQNALQLMVS